MQINTKDNHEKIRPYIASYGLDDSKPKYYCHNAEACSKSITWDDWHCNGCAYHGTRPGDTAPSHITENITPN